MNKMILAGLLVLGLSAQAFADPDQSLKRQTIAINAANQCARITDALNALAELKAEAAYAGDFVDSDFTSSSLLKHITPGMMTTLFGFVVPSLQTNYDDSSNGGRNKQILLQVRN